jgi:hypothetical protein
MTAKIDEFALNLPMMSPSPMASTGSAETAIVMPANGAEDTSITIGDPVPDAIDPQSITVYANSINPVSYGMTDDGIAAFDIVFSVGVMCGETSKTYQVVKRIGIDKKKLAGDVEKETPMSIVETKAAKPEVKPEAPIKKVGLTEQTIRMRKLAGLE